MEDTIFERLRQHLETNGVPEDMQKDILKYIVENEMMYLWKDRFGEPASAYFHSNAMLNVFLVTADIVIFEWLNENAPKAWFRMVFAPPAEKQKLIDEYNSCRTECDSCPFTMTDAAEMAQNYGCLPSPGELVDLKVRTGHNWSCHGNPKKMCVGFAKHIKKDHPDLSVKGGNLISSETYLNHGEQVALLEANGEIKFVEKKDGNMQM